jgi:hypothetical protein
MTSDTPISLKRVTMNCCPGSKNSNNGKTARYERIINELCHFYKVSLIKTGLMFPYTILIIKNMSTVLIPS